MRGLRVEDGHDHEYVHARDHVDEQRLRPRDRARARLPHLAWLLFFVSCADTGGARLTAEIYAQGSDRTSLEVGDARFELTRADVAFGPVYFCASEGADAELCESALAEYREAALIDALDAESRPVGALEGVRGEIRSAVYDYGVVWLLTQQGPRPLEGVEHSAVLEGTLERAGERLSFTASIDVEPRERGALSVNGQRTRHDLRPGDRLTLVVDPYAWLRAIDVDALFALAAETGGEVAIVPETQAYEAIRQGMQNRAPVRFEWD